MWCLVSQPNGSANAASSMVIEVRVGNKATGQECLNQVCQKLGIIESDYFGLQFKGPHNEELWLNLRNEIRQEISAPLRPTSDGLKLPAIRFQLRVKFWVPPHLLLQESTRHQFYLHARVELLEEHLIVRDFDTAVRICALAAQAECGDASGTSIQTEFYLGCLPGLIFDCLDNKNNQPSPSRNRNGRPFHFHSHVARSVQRSTERSQFLPEGIKKEEWLIHVQRHHQSLKGMPASVAEYWTLKEVSKLEGYGTETFFARLIGMGSSICTVSVSPQGVAINNLETEQNLSISFSSIEVATNNNARFLLKFVNDSGVADSIALKLETYQASVSLYRAITEKHAFYSCETVRSAVTSQFVRDLKGTIASFFNENTDLGKKYVFDIKRTCREVYDNARRILYQNGGAHLTVLPVPESPDAASASVPCSNSSCMAVREHLSRIQEALLCRICMDKDIEVAFCPCGHSLACLPCAQRCHQCPVCRASISHTQTIFLPLIGIERKTDSDPKQVCDLNCEPADT